MPVGNDVVDLGDPENQPQAIHPRFDERAFTARERRHLADRDTAHRTRWLLWSAKEAAFKAARKLDPGVRFLPRRFTVELEGEAGATVRHSAGLFDVTFTGAEDWVHAVASVAEGVRGVRTAMVERVRAAAGPGDVSARVRILARERIARLLSVPADEVRIVSCAGIPVARRAGHRLPIDVSLSHHGRFLALALSAAGGAPEPLTAHPEMPGCDG